MPKVYINRPISVNLTVDSADTVHLKPGLQDVSQELAEHWFVKANCQDLSELTDDTAANEVIAQLEAQLADSQSELTKVKGMLIDGQHRLDGLQADLAAKTKLASDTAAKLQKSQADNKAKDDRIAALEKELLAAKANYAPAAGQST